MIPIPLDYAFGVAAAGFRKPGRHDLATAVSRQPAAAAGLFTTNAFQAAPVVVGKRLIESGAMARAVIMNSGQANACTGESGVVDCERSLSMAGAELGLEPGEILPASTGVIGPRINMDAWRQAMEPLGESLGAAGPLDFARAIMTTDAFPKIAWTSVPAGGGKEIRILGIAKGAGMICPNMATMLGLILCDAKVDGAVWKGAVADAVTDTFNRVSVDGDTSTNDTVYALSNGASGVNASTKTLLGPLTDALREVCGKLAYLLVQDGEGASRVIRVRVSGAAHDVDAEKVARTVGHSPLVKTAINGRDANWGRIVAAVGRSGAAFRPEDAAVSLNGVLLFAHGKPMVIEGLADPSTAMDELLAPSLAGGEARVDISLGAGDGEYELLASDLGHEYVNINASYRT